VPFTDPPLVRPSYESERDSLLKEECLVGKELGRGAVRKGDAEAVCCGAEVLAAVAALFHVKR
jgi:hypothetical protein